jgi:hypothetical protein
VATHIRTRRRRRGRKEDAARAGIHVTRIDDHREPQYDKIDVKNSRVEIVDLADTTYQVVIMASTHSPLEEPIKTSIIQEALTVQKELTPTP